MPSDRIMELYDQGLSAREIGALVGRTRNAVLGHVWRYKRNPNPKLTKPRPERSTIDAVMASNGGNLSATAKQLDVHAKTLWLMGYRGNKRRGPNRAKDPDTMKLIDAIEASGLTDRFITEELDMSNRNIHSWRTGKFSPHPFMAQCVWSVLAKYKNTPGY